MARRVEARIDGGISARIVRRVPMCFAAGADAALDRPAHVRAASGMARVNGRVAVVPDDSNFVALVDPVSGLAGDVVLPAGVGGVRQFDDVRGNKRFKLDLESAVALREDDGAETLVAFGSGSTELRERIVVVRGIGTASPQARLVDAFALYRRLRAETEFSGSEMNVEGAAVAGTTLRLFNRGNGAPRGGLVPLDATCDLELASFLAYLHDPAGAQPPEPREIVRYDLGTIGGVRLTFTDAWAADGAVLFAAAAEDSPDATRDGPVDGSAIGIIDGGGARYTIVRGGDGAPYRGKMEGILPHGSHRLLAVVDRDDPAVPSDLLEIELTGDWPI